MLVQLVFLDSGFFWISKQDSAPSQQNGELLSYRFCSYLGFNVGCFERLVRGCRAFEVTEVQSNPCSKCFVFEGFRFVGEIGSKVFQSLRVERQRASGMPR